MGRKNRGLNKGRVSRIGSYAIASSIKDPTCDPSYRESDVKDYWLDRNQRILDWLLCERSSIICLQEFWVGNEELVNIYDKRLGDAGYINFKLARTNNRGDGLLTAVHKDYFKIISHQELLFNDFGDRVAQLLHVELVAPFCAWSDCVSDWNGSKRGHVYKFLRSQGFVSSYDTAHQYTDADAHKWISHRNHRGNICGVDFIWLLNPNRYRKLLKTSWSEAVFGMFKYQLRRASLTEDDAFAFLKADSQGDYITYSGFCEALRHLKLIGCNGLSAEEIQELWVQADIDGNGVLDYKEFKQRIWKASLSEQGLEVSDDWDDVVNGTEQTIGFSVKNAVLFPTEVEKGMWPEDYSLSDHARLTVVFSPVRMPCSRLTPRILLKSEVLAAVMRAAVYANASCFRSRCK
ncbi:hypothetical protein DH2020_031087 [Rehmannia glutinosa]|uniref:EF-hand domain-containing protein n=1 Tax=Rehmannia glutinosa TaxID=99300 RepID=A0ABR0VM03_REHGL